MFALRSASIKTKFVRMRVRMICAIIYVSEGVDRSIISRLTDTATKSGRLGHSFIDVVYGRTAFFLVGGDDIVEHSIDLCKEAFNSVSYDNIHGTHPALGVVDHICFSPLGSETLADTRLVADKFAQRLNEEQGIPIFKYGPVSPNQRALKDVRRDLGYFVLGGSMIENIRQSKSIPDIGDILDLNNAKGIACIGVVPYLQNFNMRFRKDDDKKLIVKVTKMIREDDIEALTLEHDEGAFEIACNLKRPTIVTPNMVLEKAEKAILELGLNDKIAIAHSYTTGPSETELISRFL